MNLKAFLVKNKIPFEFIEKKSTHHSNEASAATGIPVSRLMKTLVFVDDESKPVIAIVMGNDDVSRHRLQQAAGKKSVKIAPENFAEHATGYPTGGIPPFGHRKRFRTFIDRKVLENKDVWCGGGCRTKLVKLRTSDILKFTDSAVCDISV
jgi:Cys-tRNA(Pro) deacylase